MKRLITIAALAVLLGAPVQAQDQTGQVSIDATGGMSADTTAPAPTLVAEDPSVEMLFWDSIKDSANADLYLAYLQRYPNGVFRVIAEAKLKEIYSGGSDSVADTAQDESGVDGTEAAEPAPPTVVVVPGAAPRGISQARATRMSVQRQLRRVGCYSGAIDGVWGPRSRAAARAFNRRTTGANISVTNPGRRAVTVVRSVRRRVCF